MASETNDQILSLLQDIKADQERTSKRLDALEEQRAAGTTEDKPEAETEKREAAPAPALDPEAIADAISRSVTQALDARLPKPDAEDETETRGKEDGEVADLRAKVEALEAEREAENEAIASLIGSGRVGRATVGGQRVPSFDPFDSDGNARTIDALIERAKSEQAAPVMVHIVSRHKDAIAISREPNGHLPRGERGKQYLQAAHNGPEVLRALCLAAERDGIIGDLAHGWR